jgi:hypothetical protein
MPTVVFHGTRVGSVASIFDNGLAVPGSRSGVPVVNGSAYGVAIYTARDAMTSNGYAPEGFMFVCLGLVGPQFASVTQDGQADSKVPTNFVLFKRATYVLPVWLVRMCPSNGPNYFSDSRPASFLPLPRPAGVGVVECDGLEGMDRLVPPPTVMRKLLLSSPSYAYKWPILRTAPVQPPTPWERRPDVPRKTRAERKADVSQAKRYNLYVQRGFTADQHRDAESTAAKKVRSQRSKR